MGKIVAIGCQVDTLLSIDGDITENEIREKILSANIICVWGGTDYDKSKKGCNTYLFRV